MTRLCVDCGRTHSTGIHGSSPEAPSEMDTVQGRDAWEAGYEAALTKASAMTGHLNREALSEALKAKLIVAIPSHEWIDELADEYDRIVDAR